MSDVNGQGNFENHPGGKMKRFSQAPLAWRKVLPMSLNPHPTSIAVTTSRAIRKRSGALDAIGENANWVHAKLPSITQMRCSPAATVPGIVTLLVEPLDQVSRFF